MRRNEFVGWVIAGMGICSAAAAVTVAEKNQVLNPPTMSGAPNACTVTLAFKPAINEGFGDKHGFLVIAQPNGSKLEVRGGPSHRGPSSPGMGPVGNPFNCNVTTDWGVVAPYVGPHGKLGTTPQGRDVFSPDGNVAAPAGVTAITTSADNKKTCEIATCVMKVVSAAGKSCKPYTVGVGALRNSNTIISFALAACGVSDPLPQGIEATGWGTNWGP